MPATLNTAQLLKNNRICIILPTYNNSRTLAEVVEGILELTVDLIVVNDGSTDDTLQVLKKYPDLQLVSYKKNKGKGNALLSGFRYALSKGYMNAITLDSDGQHNPQDIMRFIEKLLETGESLIIGERNMGQSSVPAKSNFGRKFSNFWFWVETGIRQNDTQSGYRLYPLLPVGGMKFFTSRFEFEIEIIVRLAWKGIKVAGVPVDVKYFTKEERVSHFRPVRDFARISMLNTILVILAFTWYRPLMYLRDTPWQQLLFNKEESTLVRSLSVALGVFMGIIPVWGFQLISAIALAFLFRLNKALVILFANVSVPPMIPIILYLSLLCGGLWYEHPVVRSIDAILSFESVKPIIEQYIIGSFTLAFIASATFGFLAWLILSIVNRIRGQI